MEFWRTIDSAGSEPFNLATSCAQLSASLDGVGEGELLEFCATFDEKMDEAYTWELWAFAYLANGGCGDDSFSDFRGSLILSGQAVFERAVNDPEALLDLGEAHLSGMFDEGASYCGPTAYQALTGEYPATGRPRKTDPSGQEWEESADALKALLPKAWAVYGWSESPAPAAPTVAPPKRPWWRFW